MVLTMTGVFTGFTPRDVAKLSGVVVLLLEAPCLLLPHQLFPTSKSWVLDDKNAPEVQLRTLLQLQTILGDVIILFSYSLFMILPTSQRILMALPNDSYPHPLFWQHPGGVMFVWRSSWYSQ